MWDRKIRQFRHRKGWRQSELAEVLKVTQASVSRWESGEQVPDPRYQRLLRDLMAQGGLDTDSRLVIMAKYSPFTESIWNEEHRLVAGSRSFRELFGYEDGDTLRPERTSPGAAKAIKRCGDSLWNGEIAYITFVSGIVSTNGVPTGLRYMWTPLALSTGEMVLYCQLRAEPNIAADDPRMDPDPPIEITYLSDIVD